MLAHDLLVWTQALAVDGELAKGEPKRIRYRLLVDGGRDPFLAVAALRRTFAIASTDELRSSLEELARCDSLLVRVAAANALR